MHVQIPTHGVDHARPAVQSVPLVVVVRPLVDGGAQSVAVHPHSRRDARTGGRLLQGERLSGQRQDPLGRRPLANRAQPTLPHGPRTTTPPSSTKPSL